MLFRSMDFWGEEKYREEMQYKTIVHRVADCLPLDPKKVNSKSYAYVEAQEKEDYVQREVQSNANGEVIDIIPDYVVDGPPTPTLTSSDTAPVTQPVNGAAAASSGQQVAFNDPNNKDCGF